MSNEKGITAKDIRALLADKYCDTRQYVTASEVGCNTGFSERRIDFVVCHCWASESFKIELFEIKISKPDFRRELEDPSKHNVFFKEADTYSIVAPDYVLDDMSIIPPKWGVYKVVEDENGKLAIKTARKPMALHDEHVSERGVGRPFFASLCRAMNNQSTAKAALYAERAKMEEEIRARLESQIANGAHIVPSWEYSSLKNCKDICDKLDINHWYGGLSDWHIKSFREAKHIAEQLHILNNELAEPTRLMGRIRKMIKEVLDGADASEAANKVWSCIGDKLENLKEDEDESCGG